MFWRLFWCLFIINRLSIIVQINGRCILSQCISMPVSLTAPDGAVESLLDAVLPDTLYVLMDVFDVFLLASSLCTAVLPHNFCSTASKGESPILCFYTSPFNLLINLLKCILFILILVYLLQYSFCILYVLYKIKDLLVEVVSTS